MSETTNETTETPQEFDTPTEPGETPAPETEETEEPAPVVEPSLVGKVVTFRGKDADGNERDLFGIVLGAHPIDEDKLDVARLQGNLNASYDPDELTVL